MENLEPILSFRGEYRFLSNFYPAKVVVPWGEYRTAEHAYVAAKTNNQSTRNLIASMEKPRAVKMFGRTMKVVSHWQFIRLPTMRQVVSAKFEQNPDLAELLLATGDRPLVEGNQWNDTFWGMCSGIGENRLGRILMATRSNLKCQ